MGSASFVIMDELLNALREFQSHSWSAKGLRTAFESPTSRDSSSWGMFKGLQRNAVCGWVKERACSLEGKWVMVEQYVGSIYHERLV